MRSYIIAALSFALLRSQALASPMDKRQTDPTSVLPIIGDLGSGVVGAVGGIFGNVEGAVGDITGVVENATGDVIDIVGSIANAAGNFAQNQAHPPTIAARDTSMASSATPSATSSASLNPTGELKAGPPAIPVKRDHTILHVSASQSAQISQSRSGSASMAAMTAA